MAVLIRPKRSTFRAHPIHKIYRSPTASGQFRQRSLADSFNVASVPVAQTPPNAAGERTRDTYLDLLRAAAVIRVVMLHSLFVGWITFVWPSMGLMFALGGSLMASSLDRYGLRAVLNRFKRMLPPLWLLGLVTVPLMIALGWRSEDGGAHPFGWYSLTNWVFPVYDPPGSERLDEIWRVLWYLRTYVWLIALSPVLLWAFRRKPWLTILAPLSVLIIVPNRYLNDNGHLRSALLDLVTYSTCWTLGFAHQSRLLARISVKRYVLIAVAFASTAVYLLIPHLSERELQVTNHPLLNVFWSATFILVLLRIRPSMSWLERRARLHSLVRLINRRAITIYLWHVPAILVAGWGLESMTDFNPRDLQRMSLNEGFALLIAVAFLVAVAGLVFGWVEDLSSRPVRVALDVRVDEQRRRERTRLVA